MALELTGEGRAPLMCKPTATLLAKRERESMVQLQDFCYFSSCSL